MKTKKATTKCTVNKAGVTVVMSFTKECKLVDRYDAPEGSPVSNVYVDKDVTKQAANVTVTVTPA